LFRLLTLENVFVQPGVRQRSRSGECAVSVDEMSVDMDATDL
jgi:hypothetical protein